MVIKYVFTIHKIYYIKNKFIYYLQKKYDKIYIRFHDVIWLSDYIIYHGIWCNKKIMFTRVVTLYSWIFRVAFFALCLLLTMSFLFLWLLVHVVGGDILLPLSLVTCHLSLVTPTWCLTLPSLVLLVTCSRHLADFLLSSLVWADHVSTVHSLYASEVWNSEVRLTSGTV